MKIGKLIVVGLKWALLQLPLAFALMILSSLSIIKNIESGQSFNPLIWIGAVFLGLIYNGFLLTRFNGFILGKQRFSYGVKRGRR